MHDLIQIIIGLLLSYLLGSIPASVWVGKVFYKIDIREHGSGNAGATNTVRILGYKAGIPVMIFDIAKGWFPVFAVSHLLKWEFPLSSMAYIQIAFGIAAVIGHVFPIYIGFRGGKGVGTFAGVAVGLFPYAFLSSLAVFIIVVYITRYVSLGSIAAAIAFPIFLILVFENYSVPLIGLGVFASVFIIFTHRKNIQKLLNGTENKFTGKSKQSSGPF